MKPGRPASDGDRRAAYEERFDLGALFEFSNVVNSSLDLQFILSHLLLTVMGKLLSLRGIVALAKGDTTFNVEIAKGLPSAVIGTELAIRKLPDRLIDIGTEDARKSPWVKFFRENGIGVLIPMHVQGKVLGVVGFAKSVSARRITSKERTYVRSLANLAGAAIAKSIMIGELRGVNRRLDGKIQELNTLFELGKEFNSVLDAERIVKLLIFSLIGQVGATRYLLCLQEEGEMRVVASRLDTTAEPGLLRLLGVVQRSTAAAELTRKNEAPLQRSLDQLGLQVVVPLQIQGQTKGILALGERLRGTGYSKADLEFIASLGNLAVISLENARLFHEAIERQKLEDDLVIAKEIQRGLLPAELPHLPRVDVAAVNISSKQVGGDYYDIIPLPDERFIVAIGDVSGKGTPASLLMANLQATIRALGPLSDSLSVLTQRVNDLISENTSAGRFITFFWGILDCRSMTLTYVNAGHNPPFVFHPDGSVDRLDRGGIILGIMKTRVPYEEATVRLARGDVLVLFTDGVSEAMNTLDEEWGEDRLQSLGRACEQCTAQDALSRIVDAVRAHSSGTTQSDDITLLVAKVTG